MKLDKTDATIRALHDAITKLEGRNEKIESDAKKAQVDAAKQLASKQDAFDQLNTLFAEQV